MIEIAYWVMVAFGLSLWSWSLVNLVRQRRRGNRVFPAGMKKHLIAVVVLASIVSFVLSRVAPDFVLTHKFMVMFFLSVIVLGLIAGVVLRLLIRFGVLPDRRKQTQ